MTPERQMILAGEILDLSDKIDHDAKNGFEVDLEDYMNPQKMANILCRSIASFSSEEEKQAFIEKRRASKTDTGIINV